MSNTVQYPPVSFGIMAATITRKLGTSHLGPGTFRLSLGSSVVIRWSDRLDCFGRLAPSQ